MQNQFSPPPPPVFVIPPQAVTPEMCCVYIPTPAEMVQHLLQTAQRMEELETENYLLQNTLDTERDEHAREISNLKASDMTEALATLKITTASTIDKLCAVVHKLEGEVTQTLSDPRLKELDRKLSKLGREIKKAEGINRTISDLETENAYLRTELDSVNAALKGHKLMEVDFKKSKTNQMEMLRRSDARIQQLEAVIVALRMENMQMAQHAVAEDQAREQLSRFLTPGAGYQPTTITMFRQ